jgi:ribosomal protein L37AE/L43A
MPLNKHGSSLSDKSAGLDGAENTCIVRDVVNELELTVSTDSAEKMEARARCPACDARLSFRQACAMGKKIVFACRRCGRSLQKTSNRLAIVFPWFCAYFFATREFGYLSPITWSTIALALMHVVLDGLFVARVRLAPVEEAGAPEKMV